MNVLVAVASRHGATEQIAETIGEVLHHHGFAVDVMRLPASSEYGPQPDPARYDAVVLGSAVYLGRWLAPAREFVTTHADALAAMPIWAFSSGPVGQRAAGDPQHPGAPTLLARLAPVDHRTFGGKLDSGHLGLAERIVVTAIRAGDEDDRDWTEISAWAKQISQALLASSPDLSRPASDGRARPGGRHA